MLLLISLCLISSLVGESVETAVDPLTWKEYIRKDDSEVGSVMLRDFFFLVKSNAFYKNHIHFILFEGNEHDREVTLRKLRVNGWNVTMKMTTVLGAHMVTSWRNNEKKLCHIQKLKDEDDDPQNYLSVRKMGNQLFVQEGLFAQYDRKVCSILGALNCGCLLGEWQIEVMKVDMRE